MVRASAFKGTAVLKLLSAFAGLVTLTACPSPKIIHQGAAAGAMGQFEGFSCNVGDRVGLRDSDQTMRLSKLQYQNTIRDILVYRLGANDGRAVYNDLASNQMIGIPKDTGDTAFMNTDNRITEDHWRGYWDTALRFAQHVAHASRIAAFVGPCYASGNNEACTRTFINDFGALTHRRRLVPQEVDGYVALYNQAGRSLAGYEVLTAKMLLTPDFLNHLYVRGQTQIDADSIVDLTNYELVSRLAFHYWQSGPDLRMIEVASQRFDNPDDLVAATLDYLLVSRPEKAEAGLWEFYRGYLDAEQVTSLNAGDSPAFVTLAEGEGITDLGETHLAAMRAELRTMTHHYTLKTRGRFEDLLMSRRSFTNSPQLAKLYGVPPVASETDEVLFPSSERAGILTRAGMLVTGSEDTSPIHQGIRIKKDFLCEKLELPSTADVAEEDLIVPPWTATQTTRERIEIKTSPQQCMGCHASINPLGLAFESYDSLGRFRERELMIDQTGRLVGQLPVNAIVEPVIGGRSQGRVDGPTELSEVVAMSGLGHACFARKYVQFALRRPENLKKDGCLLGDVMGSMIEPGRGSLQDGLRAVAYAPEFRTKKK